MQESDPGRCLWFSCCGTLSSEPSTGLKHIPHPSPALAAAQPSLRTLLAFSLPLPSQNFHFCPRVASTAIFLSSEANQSTVNLCSSQLPLCDRPRSVLTGRLWTCSSGCSTNLPFLSFSLFLFFPSSCCCCRAPVQPAREKPPAL